MPGSESLGEGVEGALPVSAVADEAPLAQARQMGGDARLRDPRDPDQIRHAQLSLAQERAQADAALVTEEVEGADVAGEVHTCAYRDERI